MGTRDPLFQNIIKGVGLFFTAALLVTLVIMLGMATGMLSKWAFDLSIDQYAAVALIAILTYLVCLIAAMIYTIENG